MTKVKYLPRFMYSISTYYSFCLLNHAYIPCLVLLPCVFVIKLISILYCPLGQLTDPCFCDFSAGQFKSLCFYGLPSKSLCSFQIILNSAARIQTRTKVNRSKTADTLVHQRKMADWMWSSGHLTDFMKYTQMSRQNQQFTRDDP